MNKNINSEMTNLDILKKVEYKTFGAPKKEEKTQARKMINNDYLKYYTYTR